MKALSIIGKILLFPILFAIFTVLFLVIAPIEAIDLALEVMGI